MTDLRGAGLTAAVAALGFLLCLLLILHAGALIPPPHAPPEPIGGAPGAPSVETAVRPAPSRGVGPTRAIAPDLVAPPDLDPVAIERVEPRAPLGDLGLAVPPPTPLPTDWKEQLLFRPLPVSSAVFESMGRTVAIAGVQGLSPDRICEHGSIAWPCGQRAMLAVRLWLRGRALACIVPPDGDRFAVAAPCRLARQDVGAWLVANGWALALSTGIYGKAEETARIAGMGMFGPPQ